MAKQKEGTLIRLIAGVALIAISLFINRPDQVGRKVELPKISKGAPYAKEVLVAIKGTQVPANLLIAVCGQESGCRNKRKGKKENCITSSAGAKGPWQIDEWTFATYGPKGGNICNPAHNALASARRFDKLLARCSLIKVKKKDCQFIALTSYHSGPGFTDALLDKAKTRDLKGILEAKLESSYRFEDGHTQTRLGPAGREYAVGVMARFNELNLAG